MERFFMNAFNPAYVGSEGESSDDGLPAKRSLAVITRTTWAGVSEAPRINYIYYSGSPKKNLTAVSQEFEPKPKQEKQSLE